MRSVALALALVAGIASAHPGGLDSKGCHTDQSTGERHCHKKKASKRPASSSASCVPKRDATGRIARSRSQRCAFIADNPCPVTGSRDCRKSCPGYHVSHIVALACCGDDDPGNMEWQTAKQNLREGARCPWDPPRRPRRPRQ